MGKGRLEAFSDGVIAIIITIMVLELKIPEGHEFADLLARWPIFLSYVLSFANVGIYWNNHHHLVHTADRVNASILWANLNLLFWLSLIPFSTDWWGESHFASAPTVIYGVNLLLCAIAYTILQNVIIRSQGKQSRLKAAVGSDRKGIVSLLGYLVATPLGLILPIVSVLIFIAIAVIWFIPDRRIERVVLASEE